MREWAVSLFGALADWVRENWTAILIVAAGSIAAVLLITLLRKVLAAISIMVGVAAVSSLRWMIRRS